MITRLTTISKKNRSNVSLIQKCTGNVFHLSLPLEKTLQKLPSPEDCLIRNQDLYILVRSRPNKQKVMWQSLVNINKVYAALTWLKLRNPLYEKIHLPKQSEDLLRQLDHNVTHFTMSENEDSESGDECEIVGDKLEHKHTKLVDGPVIPEHSRDGALLTQRNTIDEYYQHFTIQPLHNRRNNSSNIDLYQMCKVNEKPLNSRLSNLDLQCFPDIYNWGKMGPMKIVCINCNLVSMQRLG